MGLEIKNRQKKETPAKKILDLKNIAVESMRFVDAETGEDITESVLEEIPEGIETVDFKLTFDLLEDDSDEDV